MEAELFIHFISSGPGRAAQLCLLNACAADSLPLGRSTLDQGLLPFPSHLISMECLGVGVLGGFILFNLHLIARGEGGSSLNPTILPPLRAATALLPLPSCTSSRPPKARGVPGIHQDPLAPGAGVGCQRAGTPLAAGKLSPAQGGREGLP